MVTISDETVKKENNSSKDIENPRWIGRSILALLILIFSIFAICQRPSKSIDILKPPLVDIPNIPMFLNIHTEVTKANDFANRGNVSKILLKSRSAIRDLETQVKYSGLSQENKVNFAGSLNLLWEETTIAAYRMERLEAKSVTTFRLFIEHSRMIQRALWRLEMGSSDGLILNLDRVFSQAMLNADRGMEAIDLQVGDVLKSFTRMDVYLANAYDIWVQEKNIQCEKATLLEKVWVDWGQNHVEKNLLANNLQILGQFEKERNTYNDKLLEMENAFRKYRQQVNTLRQEAKVHFLEKGDVHTHIKLVNEAIDALEAQYRDYTTLN